MKVANGEVARDRGPGIYGFDCELCACDCQCVFQEHNRQKIWNGIGRENKRLEELKRGSNPSSKDMGEKAWTQFIMTEIDNRKV